MKSIRGARAAVVVVAWLAASSCAVASQLGIERPGRFPMPDVTGKAQAEAEAALRASGMAGSIYVADNLTCDNASVAELHVCTTAPRAGQETSGRSPLTLNLRPKEIRTYVMPDVRGKSIEEAKQILIALGQSPDKFIIEDVRGSVGDCLPSTICRQSPSPGTRQMVNLSAWFDVAPRERPRQQP